MGPFYLGKECVWIHGIYILCSGDLKCVEVIAHDISHTYMFGQKTTENKHKFLFIVKIKTKRIMKHIWFLDYVNLM